MADTQQILADRLLQEGRRLGDFFNHLYPSKREVFIHPEQAGWSFQRLPEKFVPAEKGRRERIVYLSTVGKGAPANFGIDLYNRSEFKILSVTPTHDLVESITVGRKQLAGMAASLQAQELAWDGNDSFIRPGSTNELVKLTGRLNKTYQRKIRRYL
jgi:hypothetical protein